MCLARSHNNECGWLTTDGVVAPNGAGEIVPTTFLGRALTGFAAAFLVGVFSLPAGVISAGYVQHADDVLIARKQAINRMEQTFRRARIRTSLIHWYEAAGMSASSPRLLSLVRTVSAKHRGTNEGSVRSVSSGSFAGRFIDPRQSRPDLLASVCAEDEVLARLVGSMNRAELRRLIAGLDVLKACNGDDSIVFETLARALT